NNFIYYLVKNISDPKNLKTLLVPKAGINKNIINSALIKYNVKLIKYTVHIECPPVISNFRSIYRLNYDKNKDLKTNIDYINKLLKLRNNLKSSMNKEFIPSNIKRNYSTLIRND